VLSQCRSPYVTEYYGAYLHGTKLWIVMELMACSVADMVSLAPTSLPVSDTPWSRLSKGFQPKTVGIAVHCLCWLALGALMTSSMLAAGDGPATG
jgi:hypothetical protein